MKAHTIDRLGPAAFNLKLGRMLQKFQNHALISGAVAISGVDATRLKLVTNPTTLVVGGKFRSKAATDALWVTSYIQEGTTPAMIKLTMPVSFTLGSGVLRSKAVADNCWELTTALNTQQNYYRRVAVLLSDAAAPVASVVGGAEATTLAGATAPSYDATAYFLVAEYIIHYTAGAFVGGTTAIATGGYFSGERVFNCALGKYRTMAVGLTDAATPLAWIGFGPEVTSAAAAVGPSQPADVAILAECTIAPTAAYYGGITNLDAGGTVNAVIVDRMWTTGDFVRIE